MSYAIDVDILLYASDADSPMHDRASARPGYFIETLTTGWPRDRDSRIFSDPRFGEITARLWASLRIESMKSIGGTQQDTER